MGEVGSIRFVFPFNVARKKRTRTSRRRQPDSQSVSESRDAYSKVSSDENTGYDTGFKKKELNINQCVSRGSSTYRDEEDKSYKKMKRGDVEFNTSFGGGINNKRECVHALANWNNTGKVSLLESHPKTMKSHSGVNGGTQGPSGMCFNALGNDNKVTKVKLRVGGVTRTIHGNLTSNIVFGDSSTKSSPSSDDSRTRSKLIQGNLDYDESHSSKKSKGLQGIPWKDFSIGGFNLIRENPSIRNSSGTSAFQNLADKTEPARKSKRVSKKRQFDDDNDDEDAEIRYLEKLKNIKVNGGFKENDNEPSKKQRKLSIVTKYGSVERIIENPSSSRSSKDRNMSNDTDCEENGQLCDDILMDGKRGINLTTRQRALHSGKDASSAPGVNLEFPNGLPPAPSRKQKDKLTEVEQQVKKAEAAQRRKIQNEKAAKESEAEAIRKILGQDSNRKKREEKNKKRQEDLAQERAANALIVPSNTIRLVMNPTGTTMIFSNDLGLPSLFNSKPCSYPPPRENCAGPSCTNPYRYRDSKSKLPLCSLQCYKAINEKMQHEQPIC